MNENIRFSVSGSSGEGYLATPSNGKSGKPVIVLQEWWGLVGHIKEVVDRFAAAGCLAFAPDLYHGQAATEPDQAKKLMMELELSSAANEISSAATYLLSRPDCQGSEVSVVGFCMGGTLAIWSATKVPAISKAVAFYPGGSWERHNPAWENFAGKAAIFHCSEGDGTSSAPHIQEAHRNISAAGGESIEFDYPGTAHAFFNDDRPEVYAPEAAKLAWERTLDFLL
jgi:carboxymethylenebutenolidase